MGRECSVYIPSRDYVEYAIRKLRELYPGDNLVVMNSSVLLLAIEAAKISFEYSRDSCLDRKVIAISRLFYELVMGHPLIDGNKRLSTLMLVYSIMKNGLTVDKEVLTYLAISTAEGKLDFKKLCKYLRSHVREARICHRVSIGMVIKYIKDVLDELREYDLRTEESR